VSTYVANASTNIVLRDAIYCLGLSLNGLVILFAMFGPKVYIVIFRSEKNNQRMVMGPQSKRTVANCYVAALTLCHAVRCRFMRKRNASF